MVDLIVVVLGVVLPVNDAAADDVMMVFGTSVFVVIQDVVNLVPSVVLTVSELVMEDIIRPVDAVTSEVVSGNAVEPVMSGLGVNVNPIVVNGVSDEKVALEEVIVIPSAVLAG